MNKLKLLEEWQAHYEDISEVSDSMKRLFNADAECVALNPVFRMFDTYTDVLSTAIGDTNDVHNLLNWYAWDNDWGRKKLKAKARGWKSPRRIENLKTLLKVIEE